MVSSGESITLLSKGRSMLPFIVGERDSVTLTPIGDAIEIGDILLAKIPLTKRYLIHRVIKIEGDRVTLMGDGNILLTEECQRQDIVARVTAIVTPNRVVDPYSKSQLRYASLWRTLRPIRRYLLFIMRICGITPKP